MWRQRDREFVGILNDVRHGSGGDALQRLVQRCSRPLPDRGDGIKPTQVTCHRCSKYSKVQQIRVQAAVAMLLTCLGSTAQ